MFKNYFKIAYRNLLHNKLYAIVNILGMGAALAVGITAYLTHTYNHTFDAFHRNAGDIYRVKTVRWFNGQEQKWGIVPRPLAPALAANFPAVEHAVRLSRHAAAFRYGDNVFNETILHVDSEFFEMFDFPLKFGSAGALRDKSKLVLSAKLAHKYFGEENPVGRQITLRYGDGVLRDFAIGAVTEEIPDNSSIQFDVLASLDLLVDAGIVDRNNWADWTDVTFVQVSDPAQLGSIQKQLEPYLAAHNTLAPDWQILRLYFDPLRGLALNAWSEDLQSDILKPAMHPGGMISSITIAILLLLMACFNYINTAIAFSSKRLKEIAVRKVIGSQRRQHLIQFMSENFLLCLLALVLAMGFAEILVRLQNDIWDYFQITLAYTENLGLLAFLVVLLLMVGLIAGAYPAIYISSYHPVKILRGQQKFGRTSWLARILHTFQFSASILTLIAGVVFIQNADFLRNFDLGYDREQVVIVPLQNATHYKPYRNAVEQHANIVSLSGCQDHVGYNWRTQMVESASLQSRADVFGVGPDYLETMRLRLVAGRSFAQDLATDVHESIIVSQDLVREFGWEVPLGQTLALDSTRYTVVGVVEDLYNNGAWRPMAPAVFRLIEPAAFRYLAVRVRPQDLRATNEIMRSEWQRVAPDLPYEGFYQDEVMAEAISVSENIKIQFLYYSSLAIVIAAMGLFALVSLNIARRTKEIGIRKVLGASMAHLMNLINHEFYGLILVASLIASLSGYFVVQALLRSIYAYHVGFSTLPFLMASLTVFVVGVLTVGSQIVKVTRANPVEALRYE